MLDDADSGKRISTLVALAESGLPEGPNQDQIVRMVERLVIDDDVNVAASAAFALGKIGSQRSVPVLVAALPRAIDRDAHLARQVLIALNDLTDGSDVAV